MRFVSNCIKLLNVFVYPLRCDKDCILSKGDDGREVKVRTVHGNYSAPWEDGEVSRFHILSTRQNPQLVFNCGTIPEVCVS